MPAVMESYAEALVALIRRRIESRYRRIVFVHRELAKLDAAAKQSFSASESEDGKNDVTEKSGESTKTMGRNFEDFVFSHIDFSVYKKIDAEEFRLLFDEGLSDYEESFYQKNFAMNSEEIRGIINGSYIKAGPFYLCKKAGPLLLSIMRTVHTSLDFAPLLGADDISGPEQLREVVGVLDALVIHHDDGMETRLFVPKKTMNTAGTDSLPLLCGIFHPLGKPYTVTLIS